MNIQYLLEEFARIGRKLESYEHSKDVVREMLKPGNIRIEEPEGRSDFSAGREGRVTVSYVLWNQLVKAIGL